MKNRRYSYIRGKQDLEDELKTMIGYANHKLEIEKEFTKYILPYINNKKVFEPCCGIGYLANRLSKLTPTSEYYCIDQNPYLIKEAKRRYQSDKLKFYLVDMYDLPNYEKEFDVSYIFNSLMVLPHYDQMMEDLIKVTKDHIFISSLFYDGWIDFNIKIREWKMEAGKKDYNKYYNVYSMQKFEDYMINNLGVKKVEFIPFNIDMDLERKNKDRMGTYTVAIDDNSKMEITGIVVKNWFFSKITI